MFRPYGVDHFGLVVIGIRKTCPCNKYPVKPHFYVVELGQYAGVKLFFLFLIHKVGEAVLTCTHNECFEQNQEKYQTFSNEIFSFFTAEKKILVYYMGHVFVMVILLSFNGNLEAFSVNDGWSRFIIFLFADPHLLESGQRRQNGATDPY